MNKQKLPDEIQGHAEHAWRREQAQGMPEHTRLIERLSLIAICLGYFMVI